jgi:hypothetical protein
MAKKHLFFRCPVEDGSNQRKFWSLCFFLWGKNLLLNTLVIAVYQSMAEILPSKCNILVFPINR